MPAKVTVRAALISLFLLWLLMVSLANAAPPPARLAPPAALAAPASTATIVLNPIADSYVVLSSTSNFGSANDVHVEYSPVPTYTRALIQFSMADLAYQLPAGATVLTATLKLHLTVDAPLTETLTIHTGSGAEWGEDTVNWNNQPTWGPPGVALSVSPVLGDKVWNITPLLLGWLNGSLPNRGLGLLGPETGPDTYSFIFDSRTGTNPPQLTITYQLPPPTPPPPTQIPIPPHPPVVTKPLLALSNDTAAAGTQLRVTGFGYPSGPCSRYDTFMIQNSQIPVLMGGAAPAEGDFTTLVFTVPVSAKGNYNVVTLGGGHQATTHLVVTPTVALAGPQQPAAPSTAALGANPTSGGPGTRVTVSGSGFSGPACSPVNFYWQQNLSTDAPLFRSMGTGYLSGTTVSHSFNVPNISNGTAVLWAVGPNNTVATTTFTVCCQTPPPPPPPNPVTVNLCAAADTYVASNLANAAGTPNLYVGYSYNNVQQSDNFTLSLVRFDLTGIPFGATVYRATLQLNLLNTGQASGLNPVQIGVYEMNASWPESNFTWAQLDNLSPYTTRELSRQPVGNAAGATVTWDVTAAAQDWVDSPAANYGLSVDDAGGQFVAFSRGFYDRESGSGTCPKLTVTYDPSTAGNDLYVGGMDLIQTNGLLTPYPIPFGRTSSTINYSVSPIAGKSTLLRVYAGTASLLSQVTGAVSGFACGSNSALPGSPLTPVDGPIIAVPNPSPTRRSDGLNFVLPSAWLSGCKDLSITLTSVGEPESASKLANNTARWNNINFQTTQTLNLVLIPLYNNNNGQFTSALDPQVGQILAWLNAVYPLADGDISYRYTPLQSFSQSLPGEGSDLLDDLEGVRDQYTDARPNKRYLGLAPSTTSNYGMARSGGRTSPTAGNLAYVTMEPVGATADPVDPEFYGGTWAQEIAHLFGRMHASNAHGEANGGPVDCQFPSYNAYFNHGGLGAYGVAFNTEDWNDTATNYQPNYFMLPGNLASHAHDFMSYGGLPHWTSPYTFAALARAFNYQSPLTGYQCGSNQAQAQPASAARAANAAAQPAAPAVVDLIRLSGHIYPDHHVTWHAAFHSQDVAPALGTDGDYSLELRDAANNVLETDFFNGELNMHVDTGSVTFSEQMPWLAGTARIVLKHHDYVLAEQLVSANAPTVPAPPTTSQVVSGTLTVGWLGQDPDGGVLTYAVLYNNGFNADWSPIVAGITATAGLPLSYTVSTSLLPGSSNAHVKVLVSDGIHGGESSSAAFSLPKKAPIVSILFPPDNSRLPPFGDQALLGAGYDAEDGSLSGAALAWASDRDGPLGTGSHLHIRLSPGVHHLTLTATDADHQQAMASITVTVVLYKIDLPLVRR